jgi:ribonucleoside-diphosphate reductase alpha chain
LAYIDKNDTIEGAPGLKPADLAVFDCAFTPRNGTRSIQWHAHVTMMAAAQPFLSGAISKTVNMPRETTPEDIANAYIEGWKLGLKALAIYRDGSKESQPLNTGTEGDKAADKAKAAAGPRRRHLPDTRNSITHKFSVGGHEGYLTVGMFEDGTPGEVFITMAKEGSTVGGLMDSLGTAISMGLQYGVPLEAYVKKFSHMRFEPMGFTKNADIKIAKSVVDYIVRWLGVTFLEGYKEAMSGDKPPAPAKDDAGEGDDAPGQFAPVAKMSGGQTAPATKAPASTHTNGSHANGTNGHAKHKDEAKADAKVADAKAEAKAKADERLLRAGVAPKFDLKAFSVNTLTIRSEQFAGFQSDAPSCDNCGSICVRAGNCYLCHNCGASQGCS